MTWNRLKARYSTTGGVEADVPHAPKGLSKATTACPVGETPSRCQYVKKQRTSEPMDDAGDGFLCSLFHGLFFLSLLSTSRVFGDPPGVYHAKPLETCQAARAATRREMAPMNQ